jgi:dienelactone hydrolase
MERAHDHQRIFKYRDGDTELAGVLVDDPARRDRRPGILVVHGGAGLDDHAKERAKALANLGYVVFGCDMYGVAARGNRERIMTLLQQFRQEPEKLWQRARAGLDVLRLNPFVDERVGAVGYCLGGMTVLEMARTGMSLAGVVSVHGSLATGRPAAAGAIKSKILVCHGALDPHVPMAHVTAFAEEMNQAGADWQLNIYGGAMHGFTHASAPALPGVAYNAAADTRSANAIGNFFAEVFSAA